MTRRLFAILPAPVVAAALALVLAAGPADAKMFGQPCYHYRGHWESVEIGWSDAIGPIYTSVWVMPC